MSFQDEQSQKQAVECERKNCCVWTLEEISGLLWRLLHELDQSVAVLKASRSQGHGHSAAAITFERQGGGIVEALRRFEHAKNCDAVWLLITARGT